MKEETGIHGGVAISRRTFQEKNKVINREEVCFQKLNDAVATYNLRTRPIFIKINMKVGGFKV